MDATNAYFRLAVPLADLALATQAEARSLKISKRTGMLREGTRFPLFEKDDHGLDIVRVPLKGNAGSAVLDRRDWDHLMRLGVPTQWFLSGNSRGKNVRCYWKGRVISVARLIRHPREGEYVAHRDENKLNLRWTNLQVRKGTAGVDTKALSMAGTASP